VSSDASAGVTLDTLLELQNRDTAIDRLRYRRHTLPERPTLDALRTDLAERATRLDDIRARRDEVRREEQRYDNEASALEEKAAEVERRMYSGEISSPRELQAMQADVDQLRRHRLSLEDRELDVMEQREALDAEVAELERACASLLAEAERVAATLADAEQAIDGELAAETGARDEVVGRVDTRVLADYERCRTRARGIGAARLVGTTCQGCHLSIPSVEAERIRRSAPGTIAHCDNCGCILVP
jgi:predicted  nucleic acid-binding Zn-ribbon protein